MLAHKWSDHRTTFPFPCHVQPKLNGVRGLYSTGIFQSRDNHVWKRAVVSHLLDELTAACPPYLILDGELYLHGKSLQQINGAISVNRLAPSPLTPEIEYHVFDCISTHDLHLPFSKRLEILHSLQDRLVATGGKRIKIVPTTFVAEPGLDETLFASYRKAGFEGLMYRDSNSPYGFEEECGNKENRWKRLLKRKEWQDDEFEIVDIIETIGEKGNGGFQLVCKTKSGATFNVGSGLSDAELKHYLEETPIGRPARIRYECLSDGGIPLKPTIEAILE